MISLLRDKSELQTTIRSLKDTNATLQALNRELEEKLFQVRIFPQYRKKCGCLPTADGGQSTTGQGSGAGSTDAD